MPIKDILVALSARSEPDRRSDYAVALAMEYGTHLTGIVYALEPPTLFSIYPEFTSELMQRHRAQTEQAVDVARGRFAEAARRAGVRHQFHRENATVAEATSDFALRLRTADLAVLTQHQPDSLENVGDLFAEAALFHSGRPMIIVPRDHASDFSINRVLIAWDASLHAARAVAAAMPFLVRAREIEVLTMREASKGPDLRGKELVRHLRLHEFNADIAERDDPDIPEAIIQEATVFRASLVVMGGYGRSRLREFVFGGATRLMLAQMPVPVLMTH